MALNVGSVNADGGMSEAIYREWDAQFSPPLRKAISEAKDEEARKTAEKTLKEAQDNWKKMCYCIAKGVVEYIVANMEITGIQSTGQVTGRNTVTTQQSGPTTGHVK